MQKEWGKKSIPTAGMAQTKVWKTFSARQSISQFERVRSYYALLYRSRQACVTSPKASCADVSTGLRLIIIRLQTVSLRDGSGLLR